MNTRMNVAKLGGLLATLTALAALIAGGYAWAELQDFDGIQGQSHHARMYERGRCESCHGVKQPSGYPEDGACLKCHDMEDIVAATTPESEEEAWQNPHNNLHYGTEVPCVECHGEHSSKEPLCADCHNFDYRSRQE